MHLAPTPSIPLPTMASTTASADVRASVAASQLDDVSNQPRILQRVTAFAGDVVQRVRSTFSSMLDRVGNLLSDCLRSKKATPAPAAIDPEAELLKAGTRSVLNSIPALQSMLQKADPDSDAFAAAFRNLGVGLRALKLLATERQQQGTVPAELVRFLGTLVAPATRIANNETEGELYVRLQRGDAGFLSDPLVKLEFHQYFRLVRDAAVALAAHAGEPELALRLDALYRHERPVD